MAISRADRIALPRRQDGRQALRRSDVGDRRKLHRRERRWSLTGATTKDIPWLKLDVSDRHGDGSLKDVVTVQRINTAGGNLEGACEKRGELRAEPYAADYIFLKKSLQ